MQTIAYIPLPRNTVCRRCTAVESTTVRRRIRPTQPRVGEARRRSKKETRERGGTCGFSSTSQSHGRACGPRGRGLSVNRDRKSSFDKTVLPLSFRSPFVASSRSAVYARAFPAFTYVCKLAASRRKLARYSRGCSSVACCACCTREGRKDRRKGGRGGEVSRARRCFSASGKLEIRKSRRERSLLWRRMVSRGENGAASRGQPDR